MKKAILVLSILICHFASDAQVDFQFSTGMNLGTFNDDAMATFGFEEFRTAYVDAGGSATSEARNSIRVGFFLSAAMNITISKQGFIKTGLKYFNAGDSFNFQTNDIVLQSSTGGETDERYIWRPKLDFVAIPINYGHTFSNRFEMYGGITPAININSILRFNRFEQDGDDIKQKWESVEDFAEAQSLVVFANLGCNWVPDQTTLNWILTFEVQNSLNAVYDEPAAGQLINNLKAWNIELGIGYKI